MEKALNEIILILISVKFRSPPSSPLTDPRSPLSVAPPSKILFLPPVAAEHDAKQGFPSPGSPTKPSWQNWQRSPAVWPVQKQRPLDASHIPAETSACPLHFKKNADNYLTY